jgi:hypothetical protein
MTVFRYAVLAALCLGLALGCTKKTNAPAKVSGKVTYKGQALPAGSISFNLSEAGTAAYGSPIAQDGTYQVTDLPTGEMVVTVETESANPKAADTPAYGGGKGDKMYAERLAAEKATSMAAKKGARREYLKIPDKYNSAKTSPLKVTLKAGRQVENFDLQD